jgi:2-keto-4-pentenoate hydratase/2-oxohepta-3-ene-1,7-dioic acid hydratase in catechol pathway
MTTNPDDAIQALLGARRTSRPVPAPALADADAAYAVQAGVARALGWFEDTGDDAPRHWKSGGASREAALTHAPLPPAGVWASPAAAGDWPLRLRAIEAEIALRLGHDVDARRAAQLDQDSARALVDAMCVSIEIVESRLQEGLEAPALARLADLQSHGALVLGAWVPWEPRRNWTTQRLQVDIGREPPAVFTGTHALADPAWVLPGWLRHATRDGATVRAGGVVTTGTWCGVLFARAGDRVTVTFDGVGQASVQL